MILCKKSDLQNLLVLNFVSPMVLYKIFVSIEIFLHSWNKQITSLALITGNITEYLRKSTRVGNRKLHALLFAKIQNSDYIRSLFFYATKFLQWKFSNFRPWNYRIIWSKILKLSAKKNIPVIELAKNWNYTRHK